LTSGKSENKAIQKRTMHVTIFKVTATVIKILSFLVRDICALDKKWLTMVGRGNG